MARRTPRRPLAAASTGLLLALAGCSAATPSLSSGASALPAATGTDAATADTMPADTTPGDSTPALTAGRLATALPPLPAGATLWAASTGPTGPLTAAQYATAMFGSAAGTDLPIEQQRGLDFGAVRRWRQPDGVLVSVFLGHYDLPLGAESAFLVQSTGEKKDDAADAHFTVPGVAASYGVALPALDSYGDAQTNLHLVAGDVLIRVAVGSPARPDPAAATAVAESVYADVCRITDCAAATG